ncbi:MAG: anaerobic ribonucleoside-triphosphate reductase activating protein [Candidatus Margulisbacteria bacterium]|nr:anaerobic ribonucleoside-triphosphate reductase activating protein [Candidatus Margulisiibacteriota bacterium]
MGLEIKGFIETSLLDWDGKVVSSLYVSGCNFRCPFCHNSELVESPQRLATIPLEKIEQFLLERKDFIDGICLTGGEPCLHKDRGLFDFLKRIKDLGFLVKLDTNGADPECLARVIELGLVDYVAMDVKGPLDERYDRLSGIKTDLQKIKQSIKLLLAGQTPYEFRVTVVPTLLDVQEIEMIAAELAGARKFVLQQFAPEHCWAESLRVVKPYPKEKLGKMAEQAKKTVPNTFIRGA